MHILLWVTIGVSCFSLLVWLWQSFTSSDEAMRKYGYIWIRWYGNGLYIPSWLWFVFWAIALGVSIALL